MLLCCAVYSSQAQEKKPTSKLPEIKMWQGLILQVDVASIATSTLAGRDTYSLEGGAQIDLKHKYYPIVEIGLAGTNKISNEDIGFKTNGLFGRLGVDFNLVKPKEDAKPTSNLFLLGVRLGMTSFAYDVTNIVITDEYWGGTELLNYTNKHASKTWFELVVGVRVEVFKNVYMGWSVRNKHLLSPNAAGEIAPWYVPGYGINTSSNWGVNYTVGFHF